MKVQLTTYLGTFKVQYEVCQIKSFIFPIAGIRLLSSPLKTKLLAPPPGWLQVDRPYLMEMLDGCLQPACRLGLVCAPAGFGKTTLVRIWISKLKASGSGLIPGVAWLSLDENDNDPVVFWSYVILALQTCLGKIGKQSLGLLQTNSSSDVETNLAPLLNELSRINNPLILVLDDFHLIRSPVIHRSLSFLLDHCPPQFHLIVTSRTDPPFPLALMRGRGQLIEIRQKDLRFTTEDADTFLNMGMGLNLNSNEVDGLNQKTEGWIAGLQMAALSLREVASSGDRKKMHDHIASFSGSNRYILDYLIDEILNQQPSEIQAFLMQTSILGRLCGPLCDALLIDADWGNFSGAQEVLEFLEKSNLFIVPLDDQRHWYRYHQLFADLLQKRLLQKHPDLVPELHRRAIGWYEQNNGIPQAVEHAFQIKDYDKAASLVNQIAEKLWGSGEYVTLLNWLEKLPEEKRRNYPSLSVWQVSMLITSGKLQEAEHRVLEIEDYLRTLSLDSDQSPLMGQFFSLQTYIASFHEDYPNVLKYARLALENMPREKDAAGRCGVSLVLSHAYLIQGNFEGAVQSLVDAIDAGRKSNRPHMVLTAMANLTITLYIKGDIRYASQVCQEGLRSAQQMGLEYSPMAANLFMGWGILLYEKGQLDEAETYIRRGLRLAQERNYIWATAWGYHGLIQLLLSRHEMDAVETALQEADKFLESHEIPEYHVCALSGLKARFWLRKGEIDRAGEHLQSRNIRVDGDIQYPHEAEFIILGEVFIAKGDLGFASIVLERMLVWAEADNRTLWLIRILILQSLVQQARGEEKLSIQALKRAIELAEPDGCVQIFADMGEPMARLLEKMKESRSLPAFVNRLLKACSGSPEKAISGQVLSQQVKTKELPKPKDEHIDPLSKRELEVIRLLAEGYSNKEIALKLHVSVRTVKYYTTGIYTKMNVSGRTHAAVKARELGLLE